MMSIKFEYIEIYSTFVMITNYKAEHFAGRLVLIRLRLC